MTSRALIVVDMQNGFCHPDGSFSRIGMGLEGAEAAVRNADVVDELGCGPEDLVVDKVRFDAFQWTSLEPLLRGLGVGELIVCGVVTNLCVETTIRSAFMRDYPVTLLADCCAAKTRRLHELSVEVLTSYELAEMARIGDGYDLSPDDRTAIRA
ncbi:MAG: cysteine hydrolase family protein [Streptosporangiaceae bacterium]